jgi:hypothetical protein
VVCLLAALGPAVHRRRASPSCLKRVSLLWGGGEGWARLCSGSYIVHTAYEYFQPSPLEPHCAVYHARWPRGFGGDGHLRGKHGGVCGCNVQGQVVDPVTEVPAAVRRQQKPDSLCVMFFGGPADKVRPCLTRPPAVSSTRPLDQPLCVHTAALARLRSTADNPAVVAEVLAVPDSIPCAGIPVDISRWGFIRDANCSHCEPVLSPCARSGAVG